MARSVFFSFHYQRDVTRANVVRNSFLTKGGYQVAGYWDHSLWERTKTDGDAAMRRLINRGLKGTTVTAVLIGAETARRPWVNYEIACSIERGNGFVGIRINNVPDMQRRLDPAGFNPLDQHYITVGVFQHPLSEFYATYDWVHNRGYDNLSQWVESAARVAGK